MVNFMWSTGHPQGAQMFGQLYSGCVRESVFWIRLTFKSVKADCPL